MVQGLVPSDKLYLALQTIKWALLPKTMVGYL